jgi:hypothetical protein
MGIGNDVATNERNSAEICSPTSHKTPLRVEFFMAAQSPLVPKKGREEIKKEVVLFQCLYNSS